MQAVYGVEGLEKIWTDLIESTQSTRFVLGGNACLDALPLIRCPHLVVHGVKDAMITSADMTILREQIAGVEYVEFADGRHDLHIQHVEDFNRLVAEFLQRE